MRLEAKTACFRASGDLPMFSGFYGKARDFSDDEEASESLKAGGRGEEEASQSPPVVTPSRGEQKQEQRELRGAI